MNMIRRRIISSTLLKKTILISLFILNSLSLLLYFLYHHSPTSNPQTLQTPLPILSQSTNQTTSKLPHSKPWPILPSHLPWEDARAPPRSCEAFFGNGFTRRFDLVNPGPETPGWFSCRFSKTLGSSVCEGGRVRMVVDKVRMSPGGERLEEVMGRPEGAELPEFDPGAFEVDGGGGGGGRRRRVVEIGNGVSGLDEFMPAGEVARHTMRGLVENAFVVPSKDFVCDEWIEEPTILVTRFEYANLFHTVTDWYSAYVASRVTGLTSRPHLIFLDGHCTSPLEDTWQALFSSLRYAKNFTGSVCFKHVVLVPLGYETAIFKGLTDEINCDGTSAKELRRKPNNQKTARLSEFGEMVRAAFEFPIDMPYDEWPVSTYNVLFVRREDYVAHPRHQGKVESRLTNEEEVYKALEVWTSNHKTCQIKMVNGLFGHMSMKEQLEAIQDAHVIIGAHGAGLTHIISASPKTVVLEIISSMFRRPHFQLIARWKGLEYHAINLSGSYATPQEVIQNLSGIMEDFGCGN